jgi:hypothetical protein
MSNYLLTDSTYNGVGAKHQDITVDDLTVTGSVNISGDIVVTGDVSADHFLAGNGTAGAPAISFTAQTNKGIYTSGSNNVSIATGGTQRVSVDADGNLELKTGALIIPNGDVADASIQLATASNTGIYSSDPANLLIATAGTPALTIDNGKVLVGASRVLEIQNGSVSSPTLCFANSLQSGLYRLGSNDIGICTDAKLACEFNANQQIIGTANLVGTPTYAFSDSKSTGIYTDGIDNFAIGTAGNKRMGISSIGNVGIGTNPATNVSVLISKTATGVVGAYTNMLMNETTLANQDAGSYTGVNISPTFNNNNFNTGATYALSVSPSYTIDAAKTMTNGYGLVLGPGIITSGGTLTNCFSLFCNSPAAGTNKWSIYQNGTSPNFFQGHVGIGTTAPAYQLELSTDSAGKPGVGGLWTVVSDSRIKQDIVDFSTEEQLNKILALRVKKYKFKPHYQQACKLNDREYVGLIADDVQVVHSPCIKVRGDMKVEYKRDSDSKEKVPDDEYSQVVEEGENKEKVKWTIPNCKTLDSGELNMMVFGAVQELKKQLDLALERIEQLENA